MIKIEFVFDVDKINRDKIYCTEDIYYTIRSAYEKKGILELPGEEGALWFRDVGRNTDMAVMMNIVFALGKQEWFVRYIQRIFYYDTDDESETTDVLKLMKERGQIVGDEKYRPY